MNHPLELVAVDIETTGLKVTDEVTVVGFELELGCRVFLQTGEVTVEAAAIETAVAERAETEVVVSTYPTERALLRAVRVFVRDRLADQDVLLVGYNAETWDGGFDLPFLRTRCAKQNVPWLFAPLPYADVFPVVRKLFNLTAGHEDTIDLGGVYGTLCEGSLNAADPFEESDEAVAAYHDGDFEALVAHNVVDVLRTGDIGRVARRYCSKSDFSLKSLTPVIETADRGDERR
jgi:uncharacterized protein YprB with RNaseH-like and TPR domain